MSFTFQRKKSQIFLRQKKNQFSLYLGMLKYIFLLWIYRFGYRCTAGRLRAVRRVKAINHPNNTEDPGTKSLKRAWFVTYRVENME